MTQVFDSDALGLRVRHKEGEGGLSLITRLAHRNDYASVSHFCSHVGLSPHPGSAANQLAELSVLAGIPEAQLRARTAVLEGRNYRYGEVLIPRLLLRLDRRVCPECLACDIQERAEGEGREDAPYLRERWRFSFVHGCEKHECALLAQCPTCKVKLDVNNAPLWRCPCGQDLTRLRTRAFEPHEMRLLRWFLERTGDLPPSGMRIGSMVDPDLLAATNLLRFLGLSWTGGRDRTAVPSMSTTEDLWPALVAGAEVLSDLPASFERLLDKLAMVDEDRQLGAVGIYGRNFASWLRRQPLAAADLLPIFDQHLKQRSRNVRFPDRTVELPRQSRNLDRRRERLTSDEYQRLKSVVDWTGEAHPRRCDVLKVLRGQGELLTKLDAAAYLGIYKLTFASIVEQGWFRPSWKPYEPGPSYFYVRDLDAWLDRLTAKASIQDTCPDGYVSLEHATHIRKVSIMVLLAELLATGGDQAVRLQGVQGIAAVAIPEPASGTWSFAVPAGAYRAPEARKELFLTAEGLRAVARAGLLKMQKAGAANYIAAEDLETFKRRFVSHVELAKLLGVSTPTVRARLAAAGLKAVLDEPQAIYERQSAVAALGLGGPAH